MKIPKSHGHSDLCKVEWCGIGRPPVPWCERFYDKVVKDGKCQLWLPTLMCEARTRYEKSWNFSINIKDYPKQMNPARWLWIAERGKIPEGYEIDHHICEIYFCVNLEHIQLADSYDNQATFNIERGIYDSRSRGLNGCYLKEVMP